MSAATTLPTPGNHSDAGGDPNSETMLPSMMESTVLSASDSMFPPTIDPPPPQQPAIELVKSSHFDRVKLEIPLVFFGLAMMLVLRVWVDTRTAANSGRSNPIASTRRRQTNMDFRNNEKESDIKKLATEDWVSLYNQTFDSNQNRMILTEEHIAETIKESNDDAEYSLEDGDSEISSSSDCDNSEEKPSEENAGSGHNRYCSFLGSFANPLPFLARTNSGKKTIPDLNETCVICFEEFKEGDEVVWASAPSSNADVDVDALEAGTAGNGCCKHVYHKECMVQYLAFHTHRKLKKINTFGSMPRCGSDIENPCPTCRRNFCTISDDHLAAAIKARLLESNSSSSSSLHEEDSPDAEPQDDGEEETGSSRENGEESQDEEAPTQDRVPEETGSGTAGNEQGEELQEEEEPSAPASSQEGSLQALEEDL